jgi:hypothetical protein
MKPSCINSSDETDSKRSRISTADCLLFHPSYVSYFRIPGATIGNDMKYYFTAIEINGSTERDEITFNVIHHDNETLTESARQTWINIGDMSKAWTIERNYSND